MSGLVLLLLAQVAAPELPPIAAAPVADPILAEQRGGFRLPSGIDVALSVQTQTAVNGAVLLRTVFQIDQGAPNFTIYAAQAGRNRANQLCRRGGIDRPDVVRSHHQL